MANVHRKNLVLCCPFEPQVSSPSITIPMKSFFSSAEPSPTKTEFSGNPPPATKGKSNPPISYSKHYNTPRSTTSVIKQLVGGGATLVYDSLTQDNPPCSTPSLLQHRFYPNHHFQKQRKEHVRFEPMNLTNTNFQSLTLTPTSLKSNSFSQPKSNSFVSEELNIVIE